MNLFEWSKIDWQKRNEIIAFYGLRRSQLVKVRSISTGVDVIDDDGIREADLSPIAHLEVNDVVSLRSLEKPLDNTVQAEKTSESAAETPKITKRGRKKTK